MSTLWEATYICVNITYSGRLKIGTTSKEGLSLGVTECFIL